MKRLLALLIVFAPMQALAVEGVCVQCGYCTTSSGCPRSGCTGSCCASASTSSSDSSAGARFWVGSDKARYYKVSKRSFSKTRTTRTRTTRAAPVPHLIAPPRHDGLLADATREMAAEHWPAAIDGFKMATADNPKDWAAWQGLSWSLVKAGRFAEAEQAARQGLGVASDNALLHELMSDALIGEAKELLAAGRVDEAEAKLREAGARREAAEGLAAAEKYRAQMSEWRAAEAARAEKAKADAVAQATTSTGIFPAPGSAMSELQAAATLETRVRDANGNEKSLEDQKMESGKVFDDALHTAPVVRMETHVDPPVPPERAADPVIKPFVEGKTAATERAATAEKRVVELEKMLADAPDAERPALGVAVSNAKEDASRAHAKEIYYRVVLASALAAPASTAVATATPAVPPTPMVSVKASEIARPIAALFASMHDSMRENQYGPFARDPEAQSRIDAILAKLCPVMGIDRAELGVRFLGDGVVKKPQMFAQAGLDGRLYIEEAYLHATPKPTDDELTFVIAHELGHMKSRHTEKQVASLISGKSDLFKSNSEVVTTNPKVKALAQQSMADEYGQARETEADEWAVFAVTRTPDHAGWRTGMDDFLRRAAAGDVLRPPGANGKVFTHPSSDARRAHALEWEKAGAPMPKSGP